MSTLRTRITAIAARLREQAAFNKGMVDPLIHDDYMTLQVEQTLMAQQLESALEKTKEEPAINCPICKGVDKFTAALHHLIHIIETEGSTDEIKKAKVNEVRFIAHRLEAILAGDDLDEEINAAILEAEKPCCDDATREARIKDRLKSILP